MLTFGGAGELDGGGVRRCQETKVTGGDFDLRQINREREREGERGEMEKGWLSAGATVEEEQGGLETKPLKPFNPRSQCQHQARKTPPRVCELPDSITFGFSDVWRGN